MAPDKMECLVNFMTLVSSPNAPEIQRKRCLAHRAAYPQACRLAFCRLKADAATMSIRPFALILALLPLGSAYAMDIVYKKSLTLYVIHGADSGNTDSQQLDSSVGKFAAENGAVVYLKGQNLVVTRNTHDPKPEIVDTGVTDFVMRDGLIAYLRDSYLFIRLVSEKAHESSRRVKESLAASSIDVAGGMVIFIKGQALYRVANPATGDAARITYPVGEALVSRP